MSAMMSPDARARNEANRKLPPQQRDYGYGPGNIPKIGGGMFGAMRGSMGFGGGGNMNQRPGMPVQRQNPGMMGQQAMTGARTAAMRNPMNPGLGQQGQMGPSQGMQQKLMGMAGQQQQMTPNYGRKPMSDVGTGGMMKGGALNGYGAPMGAQAPPQNPYQQQSGLGSAPNHWNTQPKQMHDMGPDHIPGRGGMLGGFNPTGMGRGFPGGPPMQGNDMGPGGITGQMNQGIQPAPMNNGEAPEEVPGAEEMANPQMQNLMGMYGGRSPMNSPMNDPRMRNFGGPIMNRAPNM